MRWLSVLVLAGLATVAVAAPRLELELRGDELEATLVGLGKREPVLLHDVTRGRRVPALRIESGRERGEPGVRFHATFDVRMLEPDGKPHELALEHAGTELARATLVLPAPDEASGLRWLVIVGPLIGLAMIGAAIWIGRRTTRPRAP